MLKIIPAGDATLLEPLTCRRTPLEIQLAGTTLEGALTIRWQDVAKHDTPQCQLYAHSDFWPSRKTIQSLAEIDGPFTLLHQQQPVAWRGNSDQSPDPTAPTIQADEKSLQIIYPWHILSVNEDILSEITESQIQGTVRPGVTIDGVLVLGEGSVVLPGVYMEGVVVIGKNCKIGPNCYIRGATSIGDKCHIGQAVEVKNSILMNNVAAGHLSYLGDTIVCPKTNFGAGTITSNFRHDGMNHRSMVLGELVDTRRRKFGSIIGDNVHTGIYSAIYPGRKIWPDASLRPGTIVQKDLHPEE